MASSYAHPLRPAHASGASAPVLVSTMSLPAGTALLLSAGVSAPSAAGRKAAGQRAALGLEVVGASTAISPAASPMPSPQTMSGASSNPYAAAFASAGPLQPAASSAASRRRDAPMSSGVSGPGHTLVVERLRKQL